MLSLALSSRISHEFFFQNLGMQNASKSVGWNLSDGRNAHKNSTLINPSNPAFESKYIIEVMLKKCLIYKRAVVKDLKAFVYFNSIRQISR